MKPLILLVSMFALSCCTQEAVSPSRYVKQSDVPKAKSVSESASAVRGATEAVNINAGRVEVRAGTISRESKTLREALDVATSDADRLRKLQVTSKEEMAQLWMKLTDITRRSILLEDEAAAALKDLEEQRELRRQADLQIEILQDDSRKKDEEAASLRIQLTDEQTAGVLASGQANANAKAARDAKAKADKLAGRIVVFYWAAAIFVGVAIVALAIRFGPVLARKGIFAR